MGGSKFVTSEPKSGLSTEELRNLAEKIDLSKSRIDEINGEKLEIKTEAALKNKFISPEKERELFNLVNDSAELYDRYNKGERTEDLLASLEKHYQALNQKRNEIFFDPDLAKGGKADNPGGEFKGESPLFKKQARRFRDVREAGATNGAAESDLKNFEDKNKIGTKEGAPSTSVGDRQNKEELIGKLDEAYKQLYGFLNDKKEAPPEVYSSIGEIEEALRKAVKYRGETGSIAEEIKHKYKKDDRAVLPERRTEKAELLPGKTNEARNGKDGLTGEKNEPEETFVSGEKAVFAKENEEILSLEKNKEADAEKLKIEKEKVEAALGKAREEYVAAIMAKEKAEQGVKKLDSIWAKIKDFAKHHSEGEFAEEKIQRRAWEAGGVMAEKAQADDNLSATKKALKKALRNYRDNAINEKTAELKAAGRPEEEINRELEKYGKEILLATTVREAAKIDSLKSDKQIEQMGAARRYINEKAEEFTEWYKALPAKYKIAVSIGLMGAGVAGGLVGSVAIVSAAFAGQAVLRVLGGSMMVAGAEQLIKISREKSADKKISKEFGGKFLEALKNQNGELDGKLFELIKAKEGEKTRRFILAGTLGALVGSGVLAQAVRNGINSEFGQEMVEKIKAAAEKTVDFAKHPLTGGFDVDKEILRARGYNELLKHMPAGGAENTEILSAPGAKMEVFNFKIGSRGPEGAIIDNFRDKPDLARAFGWDGRTDINQWAGTKAHQMWLNSVEGELKNPKIAEELAKHNYSVDAEGYAKAMRHIGNGFVSLDGQGNVYLSDNTSFFKAGGFDNISGNEVEKLYPYDPATLSPPNVDSVEAPIADIQTQPTEIFDRSVKEAVTKYVEPAILTDKTFQAAAKVPLGKILAEVPPEAYEDKYALSRYWHSLKGTGVKTPDLPGSGWLGLTYDDFRKYAEMAKFLRENAGAGAAAKVKDMTVGDFLKNYGGDLSKNINKIK